MQILTLGYEGISIEEYVAALKVFSAGAVLDVRETAWSFKKGFSKAPLQAALEANGIQYFHIKEAGNPSVNRKTAKNSADCLVKYRRHLKADPSCLVTLLNYAEMFSKTGRPACLTCYERLPSDCHRSILLESLKESEPGLSALHIWAAEDAAHELTLNFVPAI